MFLKVVHWQVCCRIVILFVIHSLWIKQETNPAQFCLNTYPEIVKQAKKDLYTHMWWQHGLVVTPYNFLFFSVLIMSTFCYVIFILNLKPKLWELSAPTIITVMTLTEIKRLWNDCELRSGDLLHDWCCLTSCKRDVSRMKLKMSEVF